MSSSGFDSTWMRLPQSEVRPVKFEVTGVQLLAPVVVPEPLLLLLLLLLVAVEDTEPEDVPPVEVVPAVVELLLELVAP
jgi:hypothetical protein